MLIDMTILRWGEMAGPEIEALDRARLVAVLPLGAVEAHGPHLPLITDGVIAEAMVEAAGDQVDANWTLVQLPTFHYSAAPFAAEFQGTVSMRPETVTQVIVDIGRSLAAQGVRCLALANAHLDPAHLASVNAAVQELQETTELVVVFPNLTRKPWALRLTDEFKSGACHAGQFEGSIVLAARPEWVREAERRALPENPVSISDAIRAGKMTFAEAGAPKAYFGDPAGATSEEGFETIRQLGRILAEAIEAGLGGETEGA